MYKIIQDLGSINKTMRLKFNLIISNEADVKARANNAVTSRTIRNFMVQGDEFLKLSPYPYLTIDISNSADKMDEWNSNLSVNLTTRYILRLRQSLKELQKGFQIKDLFLMQYGRLRVNQKIAQVLSQHVKTANKAIQMVYSVVPDDENKETEYEGIAFMINSIDNFCLLTFDELDLLIEMLDKIDLNAMALQAINTYILQLIYNAVFHVQVKPEVHHVIREAVQQEMQDTPNYAKLLPSQIPEI